MKNKLKLFLEAEDTFLRSFEGLYDIDSILFEAYPLNAVFIGLRAAALAAKETLALAPAETYAYFTSPVTVSATAVYYRAAINVSNRMKM
jgi:hypothetical protein